MNKLKTLGFACAATVLGSGIAHAQSSVTIYGSLDAGLTYVNNIGGRSLLGAQQGNTQPDRIGFRGMDDLGGGSSAIFQLENGFSTLTGGMVRSGYLFNRQAYVGLSSRSLGTLTMGHQTPLSYDVAGPFNSAYLGWSYIQFHPGNIDELSNTSIDQIDNNVRYVSPSINGVQATVQLGFGENTNFATGRNYGLALKYENGPFKAALTYGDENNRTMTIGSNLGLSSFQGVAAGAPYVADKVRNIALGASYETGPFLLHALYTDVSLERTVYSDSYRVLDAGVNYATSASNTLMSSVFTATLKDYRWNQVMLGDVYKLSKRTQLYANVAYQKASGGVRAVIYGGDLSSTSSQATMRIGVHHSF